MFNIFLSPILQLKNFSQTCSSKETKESICEVVDFCTEVRIGTRATRLKEGHLLSLTAASSGFDPSGIYLGPASVRTEE